jgi:hypothetical protein
VSPGKSGELLRSDTDETWIVERGLQLCAQNCLDIASHLAASAGHDVPDYTAALEALGRIGVLPDGFVQRFRGIAASGTCWFMGTWPSIWTSYTGCSTSASTISPSSRRMSSGI